MNRYKLNMQSKPSIRIIIQKSFRLAHAPTEKKNARKSYKKSKHTRAPFVLALCLPVPQRHEQIVGHFVVARVVEPSQSMA